MDALVAEDPELAAQKPPGDELHRQPFRIVVKGGAKASLVFAGELTATSYDGDHPEGYNLPASRPATRRGLAARRSAGTAATTTSSI